MQALGQYQGQRYGVPNGTDARVIFFNKKLFAQAGLPADWQPASWQDVYDAAAKLKALPGVTPVQWDGGAPMGEATTIQGFLPLLAEAGGTLWDNAKWIQAGTAFKAALGFYQKIYGGGLGDPVLQEDAKGRDKSFTEFAAGKIGMYAESDYMWRSVLNPAGGTAPMADRNTDVGYALIPSETAGSGVRGLSYVSYSGGSDWSINPKTKYPQAAWDFLAFLNSKAETESRIGGAALITARTDVNQEVLANDPMLKYATEKVLPVTNFRPSQAAYFQRLFGVNTIGPFQMVRAARSLLEAGANASGRASAVVNVSSVAGISGVGSSIAYAASKGALNTITYSLARALAPLIRVNTVCPGYIDTPWFTKGRGAEAAAKVRDNIVAKVPLKIASTAENVAALVCFLATPASMSVTGEVMRVDAGMHLIT